MIVQSVIYTRSPTSHQLP